MTKSPFKNWSSVPLTFGVGTLCVILGIDESTAKRLLTDGDIPGVKIGRKWVIDKSELKRRLGETDDYRIREMQKQIDTLTDLILQKTVVEKEASA